MGVGVGFGCGVWFYFVYTTKHQEVESESGCVRGFESVLKSVIKWAFAMISFSFLRFNQGAKKGKKA